MYNPADAPPGQLSDGNVRVAPPSSDWVPAKGGKRRRGSRKAAKASRKTRKASKGKMSPWLQHVMAVKKASPSFSLGDAMKEAKNTYKK
jgi:hypothetical protein